jgi:hypothetical protein
MSGLFAKHPFAAVLQRDQGLIHEFVIRAVFDRVADSSEDRERGIGFQPAAPDRAVSRSRPGSPGDTTLNDHIDAGLIEWPADPRRSSFPRDAGTADRLTRAAYEVLRSARCGRIGDSSGKG